MRSALDPKTAERLAKICGLLSSDHDGERATAALLVSRTMRAAGITWEDVFAVPDASEVAGAPRADRATQRPRTRARQPSMMMPHQGRALWALTFHAMLSEWERGFLQSLAQQRRASSGQLDKLEEIIADLRKRGAA